MAMMRDVNCVLESRQSLFFGCFHAKRWALGGGGGIDAEMVPEGFFRIRDTSLLRRAVYVLARLRFAFGGWYGEFENGEVILIAK